MKEITHASAKPAVRKRYYTRLMDLYRYSSVPVGVLNPLIRAVFARKAKREVAALIEDGLAKDRVAEWFTSHSVFFGFAVPRSGSMFLSNLLNHAPHDVIVQHEPNVNDYYHYHVALRDQCAAADYIADYRMQETVLRLAPYECRIYGEVNPFLRRHCKAIRESVPSAMTFHLVRNGRQALRSLISRELFAVNDPMAKLNVPPFHDEYAPSWDRLPRFEKLCWLWQADNRYIRLNTDRTVQFERIVSDYDYFSERLLTPLGISIDESAWRLRASHTTNRTPHHRLPPYEEWPAKDKATFSRICGEEMAACGYDH